MRFKDVFSIIGPSMIGPSSSHTAGAVRLGRVARQIFGALPAQADIELFGSFADTYRGHGTDLALIGGLLDYATDDPRIPKAEKYAEAAGMKIIFHPKKAKGAHPNTATITLQGDQRSISMTGASIGGGNIEIMNVNQFDVTFSGVYPTLLITHLDRPGMIAEITSIFGRAQMNIGYMDLDRKGREGDAMTVIEADAPISDALVQEMNGLEMIREVIRVDLSERGHV
ncbi:L-serine ammonia-lyase, iron-sulfur-dependent subunit beta [Paenibacillus cremeus]|uniref:L-serine deaminase n=1 Tax=Paenibacillus cremeus TaxID=2163881 RepID=A0A559KEG3_9BACL|nr:L-serine ammonia-lyase, iron-sulfur-dependent subunit beta [Paenibacillus cremeus]TVY10511.1 L-serine ammonia-lyase, iron-sulfur-dependent, subunit beta [Paenibacillus cremeus]